ncbi:MAG: hypothetical protein GY820_31975 [Gammaproteobacteria bacterium]|nr:hypothetical protein [Gammaproteobacteria bacterium]
MAKSFEWWLISRAEISYEGQGSIKFLHDLPITARTRRLISANLARLDHSLWRNKSQLMEKHRHCRTTETIRGTRTAHHRVDRTYIVRTLYGPAALTWYFSDGIILFCRHSTPFCWGCAAISVNRKEV